MLMIFSRHFGEHTRKCWETSEFSEFLKNFENFSWILTEFWRNSDVQRSEWSGRSATGSFNPARCPGRAWRWSRWTRRVRVPARAWASASGSGQTSRTSTLSSDLEFTAWNQSTSNADLEAQDSRERGRVRFITMESYPYMKDSMQKDPVFLSQNDRTL